MAVPMAATRAAMVVRTVQAARAALVPMAVEAMAHRGSRCNQRTLPTHKSPALCTSLHSSEGPRQCTARKPHRGLAARRTWRNSRHRCTMSDILEAVAEEELMAGRAALLASVDTNRSRHTVRNSM